jgi:uncharacterized membrane protein YhhN
VAFVAAAIGDFLLLRNNGFIAGLACFLLVLILYTTYFFRIQSISSKHSGIATITFIVIGGLMGSIITLLWDHLNTFKLPVVIYSAALLLMLVAAVNTYIQAKSLAFNYFIPGAFLFIISDATLAANKFYLQEAFLNIAVMACYCGAQYYISRGFIQHLHCAKIEDEDLQASLYLHHIHLN